MGIRQRGGVPTSAAGLFHGCEPSRRSDVLLVGRDRDLLQLRGAVRGAAAGRGELVLVTGEAGIGKTALVRGLADVAGADGAHPLWSTCWEEGSAPAFWPWVQLLRGCLRRMTPAQLAAVPADEVEEVARLVPELRDGPRRDVPADESARFRLFDGITSFFRGAAEDEPLLLVIDDLQWADSSSLLLLSFLARHATLSRLLVVGTYRDDEVAADPERGPLLHDLLRHGSSVPLHGLGRLAVAELVAEATGHEPDEASAQEWQQRTGGNPFFVWETSRLLAMEGVAAGVPAGVRDLIGRRLARLSPPCRALLGAAALRPYVDVHLLADVTETSWPELLELIDEAVGARILVAAPSTLDGYGFAHALLREGLLQDVAPPHRLLLHARVADALERRRHAGADVHLAEVAHHLLHALGADGVEPGRVASSAAAAAEEATDALAHGEAAALWGRAVHTLEVAMVSEVEVLEPLLCLADAHRCAGDVAAAAESYQRVLEAARRHGSADALAGAVFGLHRLGVVSGTGVAEPTALLSEALDALGEEDSEMRALLLASLVRTRYHLHLETGPELRRLGEEAVAVARRLGGGRTLAFCLLALHDAVWVPGSGAVRAVIAGEVAAIAAQVGDMGLAVEAHLNRAAALLELGEPHAGSVLAQFHRLATATSQPHFAYLAASRKAMQVILAGDLEEGDRLSEQAAAMGVQLGEPDASNVRFCQLWELRSQQGRRSELVEAGLSYQATTWATGWPGVATVLMLLDAGDEAAARTAHQAFASVRPDAIPAHYGWMPTVALLAEVAVAMSDTVMARRAYDALLPHADTHVVIGGGVAYLGAVAHRLGMLAVTLGQPAAARSHFEHAARLHERSGAGAWLLRSRVAIGGLLADSQDAHERARGADLVEATVAEAARLGAVIQGAAGLSPSGSLEGNRFGRDGEIWTLAYAGKVVTMKDTKGLRDIATLLAVPGREVHVLELVGGPGATEGMAVLGADPVLDADGRRAYEERLALLEREMTHRDAARAERARRERAALVDELAAARGLGGRRRNLPDPAERARKAVGARIRDCLRRLDRLHPELAAHLRGAMRTGVFCAYAPAVPTRWRR